MEQTLKIKTPANYMEWTSLEDMLAELEEDVVFTAAMRYFDSQVRGAKYRTKAADEVKALKAWAAKEREKANAVSAGGVLPNGQKKEVGA